MFAAFSSYNVIPSHHAIPSRHAAPPPRSRPLPSLASILTPCTGNEKLIDRMLSRRVRRAREGDAARAERRWARAVVRRIWLTQDQRDATRLPEARADDACMQEDRLAAIKHRPRAFLRYCAKRPGKGVPDRHRTHTGRAMDPVWNRTLQRLFIEGLRRLGNVRAVARIMGVHNTTFYRQRQVRPDLASQWRKAMKEFYDDLERKLVDRAANGWREDVWYAGACVGTRTVYDHRLGIQLLELRRRKSRDALADERLAAREEADAKALAEERAAQPGKSHGRGRMSPPCTYDDDDWDDGQPLRPRHALFLNLMNRHRNRHPDEWDGDRHPESGFDFAEWRHWLDEYAKKKRAELAASGEDVNFEYDFEKAVQTDEEGAATPS